MAEKCLELKDIRKSFSKDEVVLKEISLSIDKGEFITLLGSSGCGKTTTLRIIAGLETPDSGKVYLEGKDVTALAPEARDVNTVFQNYALFPHMTVADNIGYGLKLKKIPKAEIKKRVSEMLELVQLPGYEKRKPSELSGGQRKRLALVAALLVPCDVLILDEPTSGLDPGERVRFRNLLSEFARDRIVLISTHIVSDIEYISTKNAVMKDGKVIAVGGTEDLVMHVDGKVWQAAVRQEEAARYEAKLQIVNMHNREDGKVVVRYLAEHEAVSGSKQVEPRLEDLYLWLFPDHEEER